MIIPVKYLSLELDIKQFNSVMRFIRCQEGAGTTVKIKIEKFKELYEPGVFYEFVRLKYDEYYIDIRLIKLWCEGGMIILIFGKEIDYNRLRYIPNPKKK